VNVLKFGKNQEVAEAKILGKKRVNQFGSTID
jgi:hypothetical protein